MERALDLTACLNGGRTRMEHAAVPVTAADLARDAAKAVAAGATDVHIHPRDASGKETFGRVQHAAAVSAVREAVPGVRVGVTTIATVERDPKRRATSRSRRASGHPTTRVPSSRAISRSSVFVPWSSRSRSAAPTRSRRRRRS
jgi:uncharacterized protein (DUF849 family)